MSGNLDPSPLSPPSMYNTLNLQHDFVNHNIHLAREHSAESGEEN